jgi:NAD(P)-dependent dehydrogenase (short-subunit alcohol dehydrogenase family)
MSARPAHEVLMQGKVCLVTGATAGIGQVTATEVCRLGAHVIIVGRSSERCEATQALIRTAAGTDRVDSLVADLSSLSEVRRLAGLVRERYPRLDVLVNNAGAMFWKRSESTDGIEKTFALNHLSYFALTNLLLPLLRNSAPTRIVNVASDAHKGGVINFDDIQFKQKYSGWKAYQQSKLANILFTRELARQLSGTGVTANALHPGFVSTKIFRADGFIGWLLRRSADLFAISPEEGAKTSVYLATSTEVENVTGKYFVKQQIASSSAASQDAAAARRLWEVSEKLTGLQASSAV